MSAKMAKCPLFEEDEVYFELENQCKWGLVLESPQYPSSDDDDDDDTSYMNIKPGTVRVAWHPDGEEEVVSESLIKLADRSLMPGDVARRLSSGPESPAGYVKNSKVSCHVQILGTRNKALLNISSAEILPLVEWEPSLDVSLDSWVGKIEKVALNVIVLFSDGARCKVTGEDYNLCLQNFEDVKEKRDPNSEFGDSNIYPGQQLRGELGSFDSVEWINSTRFHCAKAVKAHAAKMVTVLVESVEAGSIDVHWICRGYEQIEGEAGKMESPPNTLVDNDIKRLKKINCFEPCSAQMGDKGFYRLKDTDVIKTYVVSPNKSLMNSIRKDEMTADDKEDKKGESIPEHESAATEPINNGEDDDDYETTSDTASVTSTASSTKSTGSNSSKKKKSLQKRCLMPRKKLGKGKRRAPKIKFDKDYKPGDLIPVEIIFTDTVIDVVWQDGTVESNIGSASLCPVQHLGENEYFPGDFVLPSGDSDEVKYGVVESMDHVGRVCLVRWFKPYKIGTSIEPTQVGEAEEISVYDIRDHDSYNYRPGNTVVRIGGYEAIKDLGAVGQVLGVNIDGTIEVLCCGGKSAMCYPQELYVIEQWPQELNLEEKGILALSLLSSLGESELSESSFSDEDDSEASWETEGEEVELESESDNAEETNEVKSKATPKNKSEKSNIKMELSASDIEELSKMLQDARTGLTYINEAVIKCQKEIFPPRKSVVAHYKHLIDNYRFCRDADFNLGTRLFEKHSNVVDAVNQVKKQYSIEKSAKLARRVMILFHFNKRQTSNMPEVSDTSIEHLTKQLENLETNSDASVNVPDIDCELDKLIDLNQLKQFNKEKAVKENCGGGTETCTDAITDENHIGAACSAIVSEGKPENDSESQNVNVEDESSCSSPCKLKILDKELLEAATSINESLIPVAAALDLCEKCCQPLLELLEKLEARFSELYGDVVVPQNEDNNDAEDSGICESNNLNKSSSLIISPNQSTPNKNISEVKDGLKLDIPEQKEVEEMMEKIPETPQTPAEIRAKIEYNEHGFDMVELVPGDHAYGLQRLKTAPDDKKSFLSVLKKEVVDVCRHATGENHVLSLIHVSPVAKPGLSAGACKWLKLLNSCLPKGIFVKGFEDRMDLFSMMVVGPANTPYEDGLFFFDIQLPPSYPTTPPRMSYLPFGVEKLNPNLYESGNVCLSLLGTWTGKGSETWTSGSNLLQLLVSIQGLILVPEPYFNEAGYEKQRGMDHAFENSRMYNELVIVKVVQLMTNVLLHSRDMWKDQVKEHMQQRAFKLIHRLESWLEMAETVATSCGTDGSGESTGDTQSSSDASANEPITGASSDIDETMDISFSPASVPVSKGPEFPLFPISKGFKISLRKNLHKFREVLVSVGIKDL